MARGPRGGRGGRGGGQKNSPAKRNSGGGKKKVVKVVVKGKKGGKGKGGGRGRGGGGRKGGRGGGRGGKGKKDKPKTAEELSADMDASGTAFEKLLARLSDVEIVRDAIRRASRLFEEP